MTLQTRVTKLEKEIAKYRSLLIELRKKYQPTRTEINRKVKFLLGAPRK